MSASLSRVALLAVTTATLACARTPAPEPTPAPAVAVVPAPAEPPSTPSIDTVPPQLAPPKPVTLPAVVTRTLANGLVVHVVEQHELPVADFALVVRAGGERDPQNRLGLATLTAALLSEGTTKRDALAIADQEAYLGVQLNTFGGWDATRVTLHTPTARLDSALALFAEVALRPSFPAKELERLRQERLTSLLQMRDQPRAIADLAFNSIVFGETHPYGRPLVGTEATTKAITRADVRRFYDTYFKPNNATLVVVGDVNADDVVARAERLFGGWKRGAVPAASFRTPPSAGTTTVYIVDKPGAPQTSVRIGGVGVARGTQDYFPLTVMNTILGGSFTSRLNTNLRETHGYTYGARSSFAMRQVPGPFTASAEVTGTKTDSALVEFFKELRAIREDVPAVELEKAKRYLQLQLPASLETTGSVASQLAPLTIYGLPLDFFNTYAQRIDAVTAADVRRVANQYVDPAKVSVVVVGDKTSIEPMVRALNLGEVKIHATSTPPVP